MIRIPGNFSALEDCLRSRQAAIAAGRLDMRLGAFKRFANRAGPTALAVPDLVEGTLGRGFALLQSPDTPFRRAAFVMFPVADGNGRTARVTMNAELAAASQRRIVTAFHACCFAARPFAKRARPAHSIAPNAGPQPSPGVRSKRRDAN